MSKIMRKAVTTNFRLSIDTYALDYFSYKLVPTKAKNLTNLLDLSFLLHLGFGLSKAITIPSPILQSFLGRKPNLAGLKHFMCKPNLGRLNNFMFKKKAKRYLRMLKRKNKRLYIKNRRVLRLYKGNLFKKRRLYARLYRNKRRNLPRVREILRVTQNTGSYKSRLSNLSTPIAYSFRSITPPSISVTSSRVTVSNSAKSLFLGQSPLTMPVEDFGSHLISQYLFCPQLMKFKVSYSSNSKDWLYSLRLTPSDFTNLYPVGAFDKLVLKKVKRYVTSSILRLNLTP